MVSIVTFDNEKKACLVEIGDTVDIRTNILLNIVKAAPCKLCFLFFGGFFWSKDASRKNLYSRLITYKV